MKNNHYKPLDLKSIIGEKDRVLCVIHPDPDSIASALALKHLLRRRAAEFAIVLDEPIKRLENRALVREIRFRTRLLKDTDFRQFDKVVMVDGQPGHYPALRKIRFDLVIDHHPPTAAAGAAYTDIRPEYGATSSIMDEYLCAARAAVPRRLATALCYGIKTDTDNFEREVSQADAEAFSRLFPKADFRMLQVIEQIEIARKDIYYFDLAFHRLRVEGQRAVIHIGDAQSADIAVILADFFIRVGGIVFVVISCIVEDKLILIFRSRGARKHAGEIARRCFEALGSAGGHRAAARAEIPLSGISSQVRLYNPESVENFIKRELSRPGQRKARTDRV